MRDKNSTPKITMWTWGRSIVDVKYQNRKKKKPNWIDINWIIDVCWPPMETPNNQSINSVNRKKNIMMYCFIQFIDWSPTFFLGVLQLIEKFMFKKPKIYFITQFYQKENSFNYIVVDCLLIEHNWLHGVA